MAQTYTYSISTDIVSGAVNVGRLAQEIEDSSIVTALDSCNTDGDTLNVIFAAALSAGDKTTLDGDTTGPAGGIIGAATGTPLPNYKVIGSAFHWEPVEASVTKVVANNRPALECEASLTGFAATHMRWCEPITASSKMRVTAQIILKATGTGSNVRIGVKASAQATGEDSSSAFSPEGFVVVPVTHTTLGEVFSGQLELDISGFALGDAVALQVGRDGANSMGAGSNDDVDVAVQIIAVEVEAS